MSKNSLSQHVRYLEYRYIYKPNGLLVVHESLLEFSLLLQDTSQVRMSRCKLWKYLTKNKGVCYRQQ